MLEYTKAELKEKQLVGLNMLIDFTGGQSHLAKMIGVSPSTIGGWIKRGRISKRGVDIVMSNPRLNSKFNKKTLRPDL